MTLIPELERELEAMAARQCAPAVAPAPRRRLSRRRLAVAFVLAVLLAATAALAAGGVIPLGAPTHEPRDAVKPKPDTYFGTVVPGTSKVLPLRVPDPDGGPPWGIRLGITTRGLGCVHTGRVLDGQVGALGQDGVFDDDGRFHPFPDDYQLIMGSCVQLDAHDRVYTASTIGALPAAGTTQNGACYPRLEVTGDPTARYCPDRDLRTVSFGALGPNARTVTYVGDDHQAHTERVLPPYGVYLVVRRQYDSGAGYGISASLYGQPDPNPYNSPITKVTFADGSNCAVDPRTGWATPDHQCHQLGLTLRSRPRNVTTADVRSPVHASLERRRGQRVMVIRWRARVPVTDATTTYYVTRRRSGSRGWGSGPVQRNVRRGHTLEQVWYSPIPGTYHGRVTYMWFGAGSQARRQLVVGRYTLKVPPRRRRP